MITGGYLRDVPKPHNRKWPDSSDKRNVLVTVGVYQAIGEHYYVSIAEEHNPVWDTRDAWVWGRPGEAIGWRKCWDDVEGQGKVFEGKFDLRCQADSFIQRIVSEHFPPETHRVLINAENMEDYYYRRSGD